MNYLYLKMLGREGSSHEVADWLNRFTADTAPAAIALGFVQSSEFRTRLIESFYLQFLKRQADPREVAPWVDALNLGKRPRAIVDTFITSREYLLKFAPCK